MMLKTIAHNLSQSTLFQKARTLWEENQKNFHFHLSKLDKLIVGIYLILKDYSEDSFPPSFNDQQKAYEGEIAYRFSLPGLSAEQVSDGGMRKPFWFGKAGREYLKNFNELTTILEELKIYPPQKLLELGCGSGWMAEFLAVMGFDILATSIAPDDIEDGSRRIQRLEAKKIQGNLNYLVAPMESVSEIIQSQEQLDAVFVFEALHHAYDWKQAITESYKCLKKGGWLIICNEPNFIHTYVSYRVAKLSNTHEIGFQRSELIAYLKKTKFVQIKVLKNQINDFVSPIWMAAKK